MKKTKKKTLRRAETFVLLAALVAGLAAMPLLTKDSAGGEEFPVSILSDTARERELPMILAVGGALEAKDPVSVTVPQGVRLTRFLVKNGDIVEAGDPIAQVDRVTVAQAIADIQQELTSLQKELEAERSGSNTETLTSPAGLVKAVYAAVGDSVEEVMLQYGCLAEISLDSLMAVELPCNTPIQAGTKVTVTLEGAQVEGTAESYLEGILTVTVKDRGYASGTSVAVQTRDGASLGTGTLYVHSPWRAVASSGTVSRVSVREGQTISSGACLVTLKDGGYSARFRELSARHRAYSEQLQELFGLYKDLTLTAPESGVVTGVDEHSPLLLAASGDFRVTLLANSPDGSDTQYVCFVGQVLDTGSDGYVMRLNPGLLSVADYTDLSGVPRDTSAMTYQAVYQGGAPIYQWDGSKWNASGLGKGDLVLFAGNFAGSVAWGIRMGSAPLPDTGGEGTDPEPPGDNPDEPGENPEKPGEKPGDSGENAQRPTMPAIPGDISLPSFGGYGGYTGGSAAGSQQTEEPAGPQSVEVASLLSRDTVCLPVTVDERDIHSLTLGQTVRVTLEALPNREFTGTVTEIGRVGTSSGGSSKFTARVELACEEDMLPGMSASVTASLGTAKGLAIPVAALSQQGGKTIVYTALEEETGQPANPVEVETGYSDGQYVLIRSGLREGDTVYYPYYEALDG